MPNEPTGRLFLFAASCALGVALFFGGRSLRHRTDPLVSIGATASRTDAGDLLASRDPQAANIPLGDFYSAITELLKREYVEPVKEDQKLASGAVRGMVLSLGDPRSAFMDADEFRAFLSAREGRYEGIGVDLGLRSGVSTAAKAAPGTVEPADDPQEAMLSSRVPRLVATLVVPGGAAARAGVLPGDVVSEIDGHWVVDDAEIVRFDKARRDFAAKKITFAEVTKLQQALKKKAERALMPAKARDRLVLGSGTPVTVVWNRAGSLRTTKLVKGPSETSTFGVKDGAFVVRFDTEAASRLRTAIGSKNEVTLDLRDNVDGDFDSMKAVLAVLAPNGTYGSIANGRHEPPEPLVVKNGNPSPPKLTLRVNATTQGPAAILARALGNRRLATLVGGPTGNDLSVREVVRLPDGTGYTLVTGEYRPGEGKDKVAMTETGS